MDDLIVKTSLLQALYAVYDEISEEFEVACRRECNTCCSHNVLATTLETMYIRNGLLTAERPDCIEHIRAVLQERYMRPSVTVNGLAVHCFRREEPPEQSQDYDHAPCPILEPSGCPAYQARPFACRAMWSEITCQPGGEATIDPFILTVNGVFEQLIEHIDVRGLCGNLIDIMEHMNDDTVRGHYERGDALMPTYPFLPTTPSPGFLVPAEHRPAVRPVLERIWNIETDRGSFRDVVKALHSQRAGGN